MRARGRSKVMKPNTNCSVHDCTRRVPDCHLPARVASLVGGRDACRSVLCVCVFCLSRASEGGPPITNGSVNDGVLQRLPVAPRQAQLDDLGQASLNTKAMSRQHCR